MAPPVIPGRKVLFCGPGKPRTSIGRSWLPLRFMRVGVYIDGYNLYSGGRGTGGWRWLDLRTPAAARTVIYVISRNGHELATAGLRTVCTCENAWISCAFRTPLGFAAAKSANVGKG
jgi:hypothetical protein